MRGPRPAYPIELTTEEAAHLHQLVRAHKSPQAQVIRARIILQAFERPESSNQQIAAHVGTSDRQVRKWYARWQGAYPLCRSAQFQEVYRVAQRY
ncbi:MAG TPA: helix-turn-helix domain-containing protein [Ktedonobacteraceae bacterium]|nr:helix-turn-helix domain-containing protein [Ktedonobacteraceae bacterium]